MYCITNTVADHSHKILQFIQLYNFDKNKILNAACKHPISAYYYYTHEMHILCVVYG